MSQITEKNIKCAHCGKESEQTVIISTSAFGSMDLDTRPPMMARGLLPFEVQECPHCHYCDVSIADASVNSDTFPSDYLVIAHDSKYPELARRYYLAALLHSAKEDIYGAGIMYLKAAWACDDLHQAELSKAFRKKSAENLLNHTVETGDGDAAVMLVDVLRRAEEFSEADQILQNVKEAMEDDENGFINKILDFEGRLIEAKDSKCHTVGEIEDE